MKSCFKKKAHELKNKQVRFNVEYKSDEEDKVSLTKRLIMKKRQMQEEHIDFSLLEP